MIDQTLILGDCREVLASLDTGSIDLVVTSPPYDLNKEYEGKPDLQAYLRFAREWTSEIPRILSPHGSFWLNIGCTLTGPNQATPLTYYYFKIVDLPLIQEIVWEFPSGNAFKRRYAHRSERWMWFCKTPTSPIWNLDAIRVTPIYENDPRNNSIGKNPGDVWYFHQVTKTLAEKTEHPCQFPQDMITRIIRAHSNEGSMVVDPFSGSGTVVAVCKSLDRRAIGIERNKKYQAIAQRRLQWGGLI